MRVFIESIENAGPDNRARRLVFSGEHPHRNTAAAVVRKLDLKADGEYELTELESLIDEGEGECARERALQLLGYRERSCHELEKRLVDDGYPEGVARAVVCRFIELSLLDDERFAETWCRSRAASGVGPGRVRRELGMKAIAPAVIDSVIAEHYPESDTHDRAIAAMRGKTWTDRKGRERLIRMLVRRGFDLGSALAAVDACAPDDPSGASEVD